MQNETTTTTKSGLWRGANKKEIPVADSRQNQNMFERREESKKNQHHIIYNNINSWSNGISHSVGFPVQTVGRYGRPFDGGKKI